MDRPLATFIPLIAACLLAFAAFMMAASPGPAGAAEFQSQPLSGAADAHPVKGKGDKAKKAKKRKRKARKARKAKARKIRKARKAYNRGFKRLIRNEADIHADGCNVPEVPRAVQLRTLQAINYVRRISKLKPVQLDDDLSAKAQQAALIQSKQGFLSHYPQDTVPCWSAAGAQAAQSSNLSMGTEGARTILGYMNDAGSHNRDVGHRRWILNPYAGVTGVGQVGNFQALYVVVPKVSGNPAPTYLRWPTAGLFPTGLEPRGRWSFMTTRTASIDLGRARVAVRYRKPNGKGKLRKLGLKLHRSASGFGYQAGITWDMNRPVKPGEYRVKVTGIRQNGKLLKPSSYKVEIFRAN